MKIEIEGIVLRQSPYKEKDRMISILTKDGVKNFLARGIASTTSKNAASCNLFCHSLFYLNETNSKLSLSQSKIIDSHYELYLDLEKMSALQFASETIIKFLDEDNQMYDYLLNLIKYLKEGFDSKTLMTIFLANVIKESGYQLEYNSCIECESKSNIVAVNYDLGGFICQNCAKKHNLQPQDLNYLNSYRYAFMVDESKMNHYKLDENISIRLINEFSRFLCNSFGIKEIKSLDIYLQSL